ncbi:MAG TPA: hypothetical protein DEU03_19375 [Bacillus sp. (in: Bacteria)]|uniref:Uncharacterized protein n=1 Tax=Bacillus cereus (strain VD014) TaxID=1053223 RepID=A0A9W5K2R3_BACC8|nr:hypothetical protein [Bacillus cereus]HCF55248.1 hypothetical protein [Bacillus sp. (in: firmicutes)]EJR13627.1 hypothetical protein IIA_05465 [Bacillus cereus VD014]MDA2328188.1 hypothetical protein [Bacillus cereus]MDA2333986.1 hypothetical protein [Bacillus cereus]MDA2358351.1 hypothetical protein [Bacillus cereus]
MDLDTKRFAYILEQKMTTCMEKVSKAIYCSEQKQFDRIIQNALSDIKIMISLTQVYMLIDKESSKDLRQLQNKLIQARIYIEKEATTLKVKIRRMVNTI